MEGDLRISVIIRQLKVFQSTPSVWRETAILKAIVDAVPFQSTPSVWRETWRLPRSGWQSKFQSTPSVWRETQPGGDHPGGVAYFNPLPPCGGRRTIDGREWHGKSISIHSLRVEGDGGVNGPHHLATDFNPLPPCGGRHTFSDALTSAWNFNPLPPCGGRRCPDKHLGWVPAISIHSLRVEGDLICLARADARAHFNPLPPCGGRPSAGTVQGGSGLFQSTPSVWRETAELPQLLEALHFNPLPPCGGRRTKNCIVLLAMISIHSLRVEGDTCLARSLRTYKHFNPLPPCGGRLLICPCCEDIASDFNPLPPCGGRRNGIILLWLLQIFQSTPSVWRET